MEGVKLMKDESINIDEIYHYIKNSNPDMINMLNQQKDISQYYTKPNHYSSMPDYIRQAEEGLYEKFRKEEEYKQNILTTLMSIEKNTASLQNIVELVKDSNENQEKILAIVNDLLLLSKEKDKEVVENKYTAIMKKISNIGENADTMNKLYTFGTTIYTIINSFGIGQ